MKCAMCRHPSVEPVVVDETVTVGELSFTAAVPAMVCPGCGERYLDVETLRELGALVAADLAREGVGTPEAFRYMRKRLRLPAKELAALLLVTPEAVSRWEHGVHQPDPKAVRLLGAMVLESLGERPGLLDYLRSLEGRRGERERERRLPALAATGG